MASPYLQYGLGPRIATPEHERLVAAALAKYDATLDKIQKENTRRTSWFKEQIEAVRSQVEEVKRSVTTAEQTVIFETQLMARLTMDDARDKLAKTTSDLVDESKKNMNEKISDEFQKIVKGGLIDKIVAESMNVVSSSVLNGLARMKEELIEYCNEHVNKSYELKWKEEMFGRVSEELTTKAINEQVQTGCDNFEKSLEQKFQGILKNSLQEYTTIDDLKREMSSQYDACATLVAAAEEREITSVESFRGKIEGDFSNINERISVLTDSFDNRMTSEIGNRFEDIKRMEGKIAEEFLNSRNMIESFKEDYENQLSTLNLEISCKYDKSIADLNTTIENRKLENFASLRQFESKMLENKTNLQQSFSDEIKKVSSLVSSTEGRANDYTDKLVVKYQTDMEIAFQKLSAFVSEFSSRIDRLVLVSPDEVRDLVSLVDSKASKALESVSLVSRDFEFIVKPMLGLTPVENGSDGGGLVTLFTKTLREWQTEMVRARDDLTDTRKYAYETRSLVSGFTRDSRKVLLEISSDISGTARILFEWIEKCRPREEQRVEEDFLFNQNRGENFQEIFLRDVFKDFLTEISRQRISLETRLSSEILRLKMMVSVGKYGDEDDE